MICGDNIAHILFTSVHVIDKNYLLLFNTSQVYFDSAACYAFKLLLRYIQMVKFQG